MVTIDILNDLLDNDEKWMRLLTLESREGKIVPFTPTPFQAWYLKWRGREHTKHRRVILKPRQILCSTIVLGKNFKTAVTTPGTKVLEMSHTDESIGFFRARIRQWCDQLSNIGLLPVVETDNDDELSFKNLGSSIIFQTAGGKTSGRSTNFNVIHLSEMAHWGGDPYKTIESILPAAPDTAEIDVESTPNGADGPFYDHYTDAKNGDKEWDWNFTPWFANREYRRAIPYNFVLTPKEAITQAKYKLDLEQMSWRRWMSAEYQRKGLQEGTGTFRQEYPEDDISCFLAGVEGVLDAEAIEDFIGMVCQPLVTMEEWEIWKAPIAGQPYVMGVDSSEGKSDYTACHIMDCMSQEVVARYHSRTVPTYAAGVIYKGALMYNNAVVVVETPGPGTRILDQLQLKYHYDNLYYYYDDVTGKENDDPGWPQNVKTRNILMDNLQVMTTGRNFRVYDERTVREMASLTWRKVGSMRRARAEAAPGAHDDLVFSLGLTLSTASQALTLYKRRNQAAGSSAVPMRYPDPTANNRSNPGTYSMRYK